MCLYREASYDSASWPCIHVVEWCSYYRSSENDACVWTLLPKAAFLFTWPAIITSSIIALFASSTLGWIQRDESVSNRFQFDALIGFAFAFSCLGSLPSAVMLRNPDAVSPCCTLASVIWSRSGISYYKIRTYFYCTIGSDVVGTILPFLQPRAGWVEGETRLWNFGEAVVGACMERAKYKTWLAGWGGGSTFDIWTRMRRNLALQATCCLVVYLLKIRKRSE